MKKYKRHLIIGFRVFFSRNNKGRSKKNRPARISSRYRNRRYLWDICRKKNYYHLDKICWHWEEKNINRRKKHWRKYSSIFNKAEVFSSGVLALLFETQNTYAARLSLKKDLQDVT